MPLFGLLEAAAVMYGMARPERGFTVITKSRVDLAAEQPRRAVGDRWDEAGSDLVLTGA